jgi:hypothetical protein
MGCGLESKIRRLQGYSDDVFEFAASSPQLLTIKPHLLSLHPMQED